MRLLTPEQLGPQVGLPTFRHSPWADLFGFVLCAALTAGAGVGVLRAAPQIPVLLWLVFGPILLIVGLVLLVATGALWNSYRSSLLPTNWFARLGYDALILNLRSYRNAHFDGDDPTVVEVPWSDISSMARITESYRSRRGTKQRLTVSSWIELRLKHRETDALALAIRVERHRPAPKRKMLGGTSSEKHGHYPVTVLEPGKVRVEWKRALFDALAERIKIDSEERVDLNELYSGEEPQGRALALAARGKHFEANRVLCQELDMDHGDAKAWLEEAEAA